LSAPVATATRLVAWCGFGHPFLPNITVSEWLRLPVTLSANAVPSLLAPHWCLQAITHGFSKRNWY
jgi:hypothetical protein